MGTLGYSTAEIRRRAVDAVRRGVPLVRVAESHCVDRITVYRWVTRWKDEGESGYVRRPGSGRPRLFQELKEDRLRRIILSPASSFGFETDLWTVRRVRVVLADDLGIQLSDDTVWRRLRDAGLTYQKPERVYFERDDAARERWRRVEIPKIRAAVREFKAILYFEDEANVSLTAFLGKTWAPRGQTPQIRVTGARGGVSAVSAISRRGGLVFRLYDKRIASQQVIEFLAQLLAHHPRRHLVVVMDQAPPHVSQATRDYIAAQRRLHVFYLPKYSPDWNPDEKVWNHLKHQELKAHTAKTKAELHKLTKSKLSSMASDRSLIRGIYFRCYVADFFG
jgi:transposase